MEAAAKLFLSEGYFPTSIEAVLNASGGSKATLYSYFSTKDELFRAVVEEAIGSDALPALDVQQDPQAALVDFVVRAYDRASSRRHRALLRLIIAERERFPDLAQRYFEWGPLCVRQQLTEYLTKLEQQGALRRGIADAAAERFAGLIWGHGLLEALLFDDDRRASAMSLRERTAREIERFWEESRER